MKQIIVYDFDKTLTYKDTLLSFFAFATNKNVLYPIKFLFYIFCMIAAKLKLITNTQLKQAGIYLFLSGFSEVKFKSACDQYKDKIEFNQLYHTLTFEEGNEYYIVSASFEAYIQPIFPDFVHIIGSTLHFDNHKITSLKSNCYRETKQVLLQENGVKSIDILYTDSYSDYHLATMSKKIYVVEGDSITLCKDIESFQDYFKKK